MKKCFKCGETKQMSEFYIHKNMKDGHLNKCKDCTRKDTSENAILKSKDPEWVEKERERQRKKALRLYYCYPEKGAAIRATRSMNKDKSFHYHHWSYRKEHWKDVIKLTPDDHRLLHIHIIYDHERMMFRNTNSILLDNKQSHIDLLDTLIII